MKYKSDDYEAIHPSPAWRSRADFIFAAYLGNKDGKNEWEQLWGKKTADNRFIVCCIPFFVHDVSLGDEVETDSDFVMQRTVKQSGQFTFRVWFRNNNSAERKALVKEVENIGALTEWSSDNFLALSVSETVAQNLANCLQEWEQEGVLRYDTGRS